MMAANICQAKPNSSMAEEDFLNKNSDMHSTLW